MQQKKQVEINQVTNSSSYQLPNQKFPKAIFSNKKLEHMNCLFQGDYQTGGLYIGDIISTIKPGILESGNIKAILVCSYDKGVFNNQARTDIKTDTKIIDCRDSIEYPLSIHFGTAYDFIQTSRKNKKSVLVHCHAGVSRSCAIVISYLIKKYGWSAQESYKFIKNKRDRVKPNLNFWKQLTEYEKQFVPKQRWSTLKDSQFEPPRPPVDSNIPNNNINQNTTKIADKISSPILPNINNPQTNFNYRNRFGEKNQQKLYFSPIKPFKQLPQENANALSPQLKRNYGYSLTNLNTPSTFNLKFSNQPISYNQNRQYASFDNKFNTQSNNLRPYDHRFPPTGSVPMDGLSQPTNHQRFLTRATSQRSMQFFNRIQQNRK